MLSMRDMVAAALEERERQIEGLVNFIEALGLRS
jgi:hypothetical protein